MPREFKRTDRVGAELQRELSALIRSDLGDNRYTMVTLQEVRVVRDFSHATVYFTILGDQLDRRATMKELNHAASYLRHELGRRMRLRTVPQLHFQYDESVERGAALSELIDRSVEPTGDEENSQKG
jgi:ribosome-binding factor A